MPQDMARQLNPYIKVVQRDGYEDRMHLFSFPPVLGVTSYFLDVPDMTGGINTQFVATHTDLSCAAIMHARS